MFEDMLYRQLISLSPSRRLRSIIYVTSHGENSSPLRFPAKNRRQHNENPLHTWRNWKNIIQITRCFYCESNDQEITSLSPSQRFSIKNLNITSKHLKSSHSKNGETHSTIIYYLSKSNSYSYLNIARQKKKSAIATFTRNFTFVSTISHKELSSLFFQTRLHNIKISEISSTAIKIDLFTKSSIYHITSIMTFYKKRLVIFTFFFISWFYISFTSQLKNLVTVEFKHISNNNSNDIEYIKCKLKLSE